MDSKAGPSGVGVTRLPPIANGNADDQSDELIALQLSFVDQTELESNLISGWNKELEDELDEKQKSLAGAELGSVLHDIKMVRESLKKGSSVMQAVSSQTDPNVQRLIKAKQNSIKKDKENKEKQLRHLLAKKRALHLRIYGVLPDGEEEPTGDGEIMELDSDTKLELEQVFGIRQKDEHPSETERERMIRMGLITPFGSTSAGRCAQPTDHGTKLADREGPTDFEKYLMDQEALQKRRKEVVRAGRKNSLSEKKESPTKTGSTTESPNSKKPVKKIVKAMGTKQKIDKLIARAAKRKPRRTKDKLGTMVEGSNEHILTKKRRPYVRTDNVDYYGNTVDLEEFDRKFKIKEGDLSASGSEYAPSDEDNDSDYSVEDLRAALKRKRRLSTAKLNPNKRRRKKPSSDNEECESEWDLDDGDVKTKRQLKRKKVVDDGDYSVYIERLKKWRRAGLKEKLKKLETGEAEIILDKSDDEEECEEFDEGFKVPTKIWSKLYKYQQVGVQWLWELHGQQCGGIVGDEMGLGKTIQVIAFLAGLSVSRHRTYDSKYEGLGPVLIVVPTTVMHQWVEEIHKWWPAFRVAILHDSGSFDGLKASLIQKMNKPDCILIMSYTGLVQVKDILHRHEWHYIILDEGHKIRNPDAQATIAVKQFRTPHRIILSGSPLQNNLRELWSLFDFIYPGKLGTLPVFLEQFAVPITQGGYSNASQVQVQTAFKCATALRETIGPYLLRRMKADVRKFFTLPDKSEQVLFCRLTDEQTRCYKDYISSTEVDSILGGRLKVFVGLINLRKICNHPDLYTGGPKVFANDDVEALGEDMKYGYYNRSGKMQVINELLKLWFKQKHKVLLFSQSKQMLDILEIFIKKREYKYLRMDGSTSIGTRHPKIEQFNTDTSIFIFLLTTRVGGLGINLTGADRVVIYDPDWNPSTDMQARERAWRIGQQKHVTIYRLLTVGSIEEKIYHRQIFKQFLTNRVLKDPRQRRFFKSSDLYELFTLQEEGKEGTETAALFAGTASNITAPPKRRPKPKKLTKAETMRERAKALSQNLLDKFKLGPDAKTDKPKGVRFEKGKRIEFLARKETFKSNSVLLGVAEEEEGMKAKKGKTKEQDDYVLRKLFGKNGGIHSALKHDTIMDAGDPDYALVEGEAEKVARDAVKKLKASRKLCHRAVSGLPTWTGQNGVINRPGNKQRFGKKVVPKSSTGSGSILRNRLLQKNSPEKKTMRTPVKNIFARTTLHNEESNAPLSSSALLAKIRERSVKFPKEAKPVEVYRNLNVDEATGEPVESSEDEEEPAPAVGSTNHFDELLADIRQFIAFQSDINGQATTNELLDHFRDKIAGEESHVFKSLMNNLCAFYRGREGEGVWRLKTEFR